MPWRESMEPVRMQRVALLAPRESLRDVLVEIAAAGSAELDVAAEPRASGAAARLLQQRPRTADDVSRCWPRTPPDLDALAEAGRADLLAGEAQLEARRRPRCPATWWPGSLGWMPAAESRRSPTGSRPLGAAVVPLRDPARLRPADARAHARAG